MGISPLNPSCDLKPRKRYRIPLSPPVSKGLIRSMSLSIIVVSWNTQSLLKQCLESVFRFTKGLSFEVWIVDNASSDDSVAMVRECFPSVNLIVNDKNLGFSRANNQAIKRSTGDYIALLNPDTVLVENVFLPLISEANTNKEIGAIGPKIVRKDGVTIDNGCARRLPRLYVTFCKMSGLSRKFSNTKLFWGESIPQWNYNSSGYVEALSGSCMVLRKSAIAQIGLMDENQFMYGDEIDWCKRLLDEGWRVFYLSKCKIIHYGGESANQVPFIMNLVRTNSLHYYYQKHYGRFYAFLFCCIVFIPSTLKFIWRNIYGKNENSDLLKHDRQLIIWSIKRIFGTG